MDKLLRFLVESGKISEEEVNKEMEAMERTEILKKHPYKIWEGKNGRWYTYVKVNDKRILKTGTSKENIENVIFNIYKERELNPTIGELFNEWIERKVINSEIGESTYSRYMTDYNRCFGEFGHKKIKNIDEIEIEDFLKQCVHQKNMSHKAYSNIRTIIYGIFRYARKRKLIEFDIKQVVESIDFSSREFRESKFEDEDQVFTGEEEARIINVLSLSSEIKDLALLLMFKTGLRVGELVALRKEDLCGNIVKVRRTEVNYTDRVTGKHICDVNERTKTDAGIRDVIVKNDATWIIKAILEAAPNGEYAVSYPDGRRVQGQAIRARLSVVCRLAHVRYRSPHKIRKTYGTKLYDSGVLTDSLICKQMGHTDIKCLQENYYYNRETQKEKIDQINKVVGL